ncbi:hypothetical protein QEO94_05990 [Kingella negevensis]|uniref:hypothetical protein n=1 Tax=Kingella negevensis TaxID=1522312 RepID=UPI002543C59E|nr:hypothetical protein [Kingella negevensis]WII92214.1 hypothetical protein QEO94_05990 [Kingella negevensis]
MSKQDKITQLESEIEKLKYHISMLNTYSVYESNPVGSLVISLNWSENDLEKAHDIFEKYYNLLEDNQIINYLSIEADFESEFGIGYQRMKSVILAFFRNNQWIEVCVAFVKSFNGTEPIEFREITAYIKENKL